MAGHPGGIRHVAEYSPATRVIQVAKQNRPWSGHILLTAPAPEVAPRKKPTSRPAHLAAELLAHHQSLLVLDTPTATCQQRWPIANQINRPAVKAARNGHSAQLNHNELTLQPEVHIRQVLGAAANRHTRCSLRCHRVRCDIRRSARVSA
jgi:uncharacterized protein with von Willebrand factor type A (vWA) domain